MAARKFVFSGGIVDDLDYYRHLGGGCDKADCFCRRMVVQQSPGVPSSMDVFDGRVLMEGTVVTISYSMAVSFVLNEFAERWSEERHPLESARQLRSLFIQFRKQHSYIPKTFFTSLGSLIRALVYAEVDWNVVPAILVEQLAVWKQCLAMFRKEKHIAAIANMEDSKYLVILLKLLFEHEKVHDVDLARIGGITGDQYKDLRRDFQRYKLLVLDVSSNFVTAHLFSNPSSRHVIVDCFTGRVLLSNAMSQEMMWLLAIPFDQCSRALFESVGVLLRPYFRGLTRQNVVDSYKLLMKLSKEPQFLDDMWQIYAYLRKRTFKERNKEKEMDCAWKLLSPMAKGNAPKRVASGQWSICNSLLRLRRTGREVLLLHEALMHSRWSLAERLIASISRNRLSRKDKQQWQNGGYVDRLLWHAGLQVINVVRTTGSRAMKVKQYFNYIVKRGYDVAIGDAMLDVYRCLCKLDSEREAIVFLRAGMNLLAKADERSQSSIAVLQVFEVLFSVVSGKEDDSNSLCYNIRTQKMLSKNRMKAKLLADNLKLVNSLARPFVDRRLQSLRSDDKFWRLLDKYMAPKAENSDSS